MILGWELDTKEHHIRITPNIEEKVRAALAAIPATAHQVSLRKWRHLLGLMRSITLDVPRAHGMFTRLPHNLRQAHGRRVLLLSAVQGKLSAWIHLVQDIS